MIESKLNWNEGEASGLVSIGTHSMYLSSAGPPRSAGEPAVIIEAGGGSNVLAYAAIKRLVSAFARVYSYDRAGLGRSDASPGKRNASNMAAELAALLDAAGIVPPYILVAHSYGGIIAREFLDLKDDAVAGMVLVETNHEDRDKELIWPFAEFDVMEEGVDALTTCGYDKNHKLTDAEWAAYLADQNSDKASVLQDLHLDVPDTPLGKELKQNPPSHLELGEKRQLERQAMGDRPVSVIKGDKEKEFRAIFEEGMRRGNGSEEQKEGIRRALERLGPVDERLTRDQRRLSGRSRYVHAEKSGHEVQLTEPGLVAEEVRWVFGEVRKG